MLAAGVSALGCELLIGDPPRDGATQDQHGGAGAGAASYAGSPSVGGSAPLAGGAQFGGSFLEGGTMPRNDAGTSGGVSSLAGSGGSEAQPSNGGSGVRDGGAPGAGGVPESGGSGAGGAPESGAGGAPSCTTAVTWYQDDDGDGYGTDLSAFACPAPDGQWALTQGDCDDTRTEVHPGQEKFFTAPYQKADATDSFDYDCSGVEEPNPTLTLAPNDCGPLQLALCGDTSGYVTNNRSGPGLNEWCGSTIVRACVPKLLVCETSERPNQPPFSCR